VALRFASASALPTIASVLPSLIVCHSCVLTSKPPLLPFSNRMFSCRWCGARQACRPTTLQLSVKSNHPRFAPCSAPATCRTLAPTAARKPFSVAVDDAVLLSAHPLLLAPLPLPAALSAQAPQLRPKPCQLR